MPSQAKPSQTKLGLAHAKPRQATQGLVRPSQAKPGQARPGQARPSQTKPMQLRAAQASPGQPSQAKPRPDHAKPSQAKPSQARFPTVSMGQSLGFRVYNLAGTPRRTSVLRRGLANAWKVTTIDDIAMGPT